MAQYSENQRALRTGSATSRPRVSPRGCGAGVRTPSSSSEMRALLLEAKYRRRYRGCRRLGVGAATEGAGRRSGCGRAFGYRGPNYRRGATHPGRHTTSPTSTESGTLTSTYLVYSCTSNDHSRGMRSRAHRQTATGGQGWDSGEALLLEPQRSGRVVDLAERANISVGQLMQSSRDWRSKRLSRLMALTRRGATTRQPARFARTWIEENRDRGVARLPMYVLARTEEILLISSTRSSTSTMSSMPSPAQLPPLDSRVSDDRPDRHVLDRCRPSPATGVGVA
jgi:hypothetical protein